MSIAVYFRNSRMISLIGIVMCIALFLGIISYFNSPFKFLFAGLFAFAFPLLWQIFRALVLHQPALLINSAGIQISNLTVPGKFFISWSEVGKISVDDNSFNQYLCIHPKDSYQYLSHFSAFKRFLIRRWTQKQFPFLRVPLSYLDMPIAEIYQQLSQVYASELDCNHILLQLL